jgi:uncharacterized protein (DUF934 family)
MPEIIKNGQVSQDSWSLWHDTETLPTRGHVIVPLSLWLTHKSELQALGHIGVFLRNESPKALSEDIDSLELIAVDFPVFTDGRGFSYGRELREQHGFKGELRATGDFMRDQLFYLSRCGFNSFALEGEDLEEALSSLDDFSEVYQASADEDLPLFRRHKLAGADTPLPACA